MNADTKIYKHEVSTAFSGRVGVEVKPAVVITGKTGIDYVRLASMKGRVSLESKGLKFRAGSARAQMAREMGLKPRAAHSVVIAAIQAKMDELLEAAKRGE